MDYGVVDRWLSHWRYGWFIVSGCMVGYICCVVGSCLWWLMMWVSRSPRLRWMLSWGIRYWDGVVVVMVLWVFRFVCRYTLVFLAGILSSCGYVR